MALIVASTCSFYSSSNADPKLGYFSMTSHCSIDMRGNEACDFYHRYKEDFALAKRLHAKSYRFSIAWTRIFPTGEGAINLAGVQHYMDVVDELLALDIEPAVTLYHWDLPMVTPRTLQFLTYAMSLVC